MSTDLEAMRAERDRLNAEIAEAEGRARRTWNDGLSACEARLAGWLHEQSIEPYARKRKNEHVWDIGNSALIVRFGYDDQEQGGPWLQLKSGGTLSLEWKEAPAPDRFIAIVAVLLGRPAAERESGEQPE